MLTRSRLLLGALLLAVTLGAMASAALGQRLSVSNRNIRVVWETFAFTSSAGSVVCGVTMEGSLHANTITKTRGSLVGYITRVPTPSGCLFEDHAIPLPASLPWHIRYDSFNGTLPAITGIRFALVNASIRVELNGFSCLFRSTEANPVYSIGNRIGGILTTLRMDSSASIPWFEGFPCPASGRAEGIGDVTEQNGRTLITVSLI